MSFVFNPFIPRVYKIAVNDGGVIAVQQPVAYKLVVPQQGARGRDGAGGSLQMLDAPSDVTMAANTGYRASDADAQVILSLPNAVMGDTNEIYGYGLGGWKIPVPNGKVIHILGGGNDTRTDGTGYVQSNFATDMIRLKCIVDNQEWSAEVYGCEFN